MITKELSIEHLNNICELCSKGRFFSGRPCQMLKQNKHCWDYNKLKEYLEGENKNENITNN